MQLVTRQEVRTTLGSHELASSGTERSRRLAVGAYLYQLAEQVLNGDVEGFQAQWDGGELHAEVSPKESGE